MFLMVYVYVKTLQECVSYEGQQRSHIVPKQA